MYYVGFSTATVVASLILFQGFNTTDAADTLSLLCGFVVTFLGVHILNLSRKPEPPVYQNGHSALEGGVMNPRLSLQGRASLDGWSDTRIGPAPSPRGHGRRSSLYRNQTATLFNAFEEHERGAADSVGLQRLGEEEDELESDDDDILHADERTQLQSTSPMAKQSGSRSHNNSPLPNRPPS